MTIKEMTEITGVPAATLRYYEGLGLIPRVPRNHSGVRNYTADYVQWVSFIQDLKDSGFSLDDIVVYLDLARQGKRTKLQRKKLLARTKAQLQSRLSALQQLVQQADFALANYEVVMEPRTEALISKWSA